ncbi:transcription initiation factor TFIID subunit 11-like isoform X2 [Homarus americanus]|uniref:transcription initiation factor TFIID subunit 11-like isoform X2 n=1 Tax=Homarus americanus TaxID=6706 RepID=UPI001C45EC2D|nr:transcription initiation factor TFIID subunit 11-like isoform X2 [Homarus americanus]
MIFINFHRFLVFWRRILATASTTSLVVVLWTPLVVPVATKHCHCGHQFFEERRRSTTSNPSEVEDLEDNTLKDMKPSRGVATSSSVSGMMAMASSVGKGELGSPAPEGKRRSERVKREKPNFYDALEYENQMRKARKERQKEEPPNPTGRVKRERKVKNNSEPDEDEDEEPVKEKKKKKKKKNNNNGEKKEEEVDEDIMLGISAEKERQYSIVLSDINFKLGLNNPKFIKI